MHSSKSLKGASGSELAGKRVCLAITGSVAAARSPELARELMRHGAEVFCVMSREAQKLVGPSLLHWATGNPVVTELTGECEHITLCGKTPGKADLLLIAPATANTIGKIARGIDDTPVTTFATTAIGSGIPLLIAPAMHESMYAHPFVLENIRRLEAAGVHFAGPNLSEGKAKLASVGEIVDLCIRALTPHDLAGRRVVVTAGATREFIDDVRFISNPSSGRMGIVAACEAWLRGADVLLIAGHTEVPIPSYIPTVCVGSVPEMFAAVQKASKDADIIVLAAAAGDFTLTKRKGKVGSAGKLGLELSPAPKISEAVRKWNPKAKLVLFKAESGVSDVELRKTAEKKMKACGADLMVANDISRRGAGFGVETNEVLIISRSGKAQKFAGRKSEVAKRLFDAL